MTEYLAIAALVLTALWLLHKVLAAPPVQDGIEVLSKGLEAVNLRLDLINDNLKISAEAARATRADRMAHAREEAMARTAERRDEQQRELEERLRRDPEFARLYHAALAELKD